MARFSRAVVTIYTTDIEKAVDFYGRILGLEETFRHGSGDVPGHVEFHVGLTTLALSARSGLAVHGLPAASPGHPFEIGLKTDDVGALIADLRDQGITALKEPFFTNAGNRVAYIADPDGNWIAVYDEHGWP
jgi:lactoylglutathione lyase